MAHGSKIERFHQESDVDHILIEARAGSDCDNLAILIHNEMRAHGMLRTADPRDDVPYAATGTAHRNQMDSVARSILDGIEIEVEMEQLE